MARVYIFAGFVTVILLGATYVLVVGRIGLGMFRFKKKKEKDV
jgi:hypothetical protein